jgi:hypothetical protein
VVSEEQGGQEQAKAEQSNAYSIVHEVLRKWLQFTLIALRTQIRGIT